MTEAQLKAHEETEPSAIEPDPEWLNANVVQTIGSTVKIVLRYCPVNNRTTYYSLWPLVDKAAPWWF
jgi:hypothetical protein